MGALACIAGGYLAQTYGAKKVATMALTLSCLCCISSPLFLAAGSAVVFLLFLFFWGLVVIADSPLFSTLVARHAPEEVRGTSLTIVNCIGFSITIVSIQLTNYVVANFNSPYNFVPLAIGPVLGVLALLTSQGETETVAR